MKNPSNVFVNDWIDKYGSYPVIYAYESVITEGILIKRPERHNEYQFLFMDHNSSYKCAVCFQNLLDHPRLKFLDATLTIER
jgi:hypothetical protein